MPRGKPAAALTCEVFHCELRYPVVEFLTISNYDRSGEGAMAAARSLKGATEEAEKVRGATAKVPPPKAMAPALKTVALLITLCVAACSNPSPQVDLFKLQNGDGAGGGGGGGGGGSC